MAGDAVAVTKAAPGAVFGEESAFDTADRGPQS